MNDNLLKHWTTYSQKVSEEENLLSQNSRDCSPNSLEMMSLSKQIMLILSKHYIKFTVFTISLILTVISIAPTKQFSEGISLSDLKSKDCIPTELNTYPLLHGNNLKYICEINGKEVIARPLILRNYGGIPELVAFYVDRALGLFKIPNTALEHRHVTWDGTPYNQTQMVLQTRLKNTDMYFLSGWERCFPKPFSITERTYAVVQSNIFTSCKRNLTFYDGDYRAICLGKFSNNTQCTQKDLVELVEMLTFDWRQ